MLIQQSVVEELASIACWLLEYLFVLTLCNLPMRCCQLIGTMLNRASDLAPESLPMLRRMVPFLVSGVDGHDELLPQLMGRRSALAKEPAAHLGWLLTFVRIREDSVEIC